MTTLKLRTNLRCSACVQSITPLLDAEPGITRWQADVTTPAKLLTVEGDTITRGRVVELLQQKGYEVLGDAPTTSLPTVTAPDAPAAITVATPQPPDRKSVV